MKLHLVVLLCVLSSDFCSGQETSLPQGDVELLSRRLDAVEQENQLLREEMQRQARYDHPNPVSKNVTTTASFHTMQMIDGNATSTGCDSALSCERLSQQAPCIDCPHVSTLGSNFNLRVFGSLTGEMVFADARPVLPSGIVLITPDLGQDTEVAEVHAKSSSLGIAFGGPKVGGFQMSGTLLSYLYGQTFQEDKYGLYIVRAFVDLKSEHVRFAFGFNGDLINPRAPTTINFNQANGAGNLGFFRGQFLVETNVWASQESQLTAQFALSDPVTTSFADFNQPPLNLLEETGWPNIEGRVMIGLGRKPSLPGLPRPFELGVSGLVGQLRRTDLPTNHIHDVWAFGTDFHIGLTDAVGLNGEFFTGQSIGNYNAGIFLIDNLRFDPVRSTGGWVEAYANWSSRWHSHFGYGTDDPIDDTLSAGQPTRNQLFFANILCDVTENLEVGFELSHWETSYTAPVPDNDAVVYHTRVRLKF